MAGAATDADSREVAGGTPPVSRETAPSAAAPIAAASAASRQRRGSFPRPAQRRVIAVANQKGGVGKTTSAVNIAAALAQDGATVALVDLDPQGNASTALGLDATHRTPGTYEVLLGEATLDEVLVPCADVERMLCSPSAVDLAGAEVELVNEQQRERRLHDALQRLAAPVDYVIIDCPPSLGLLTVNGLTAAQEVLIPIQCEYYALEGLGQLMRNVELVRKHLNPSLYVSSILLTMYDPRTRLAEQVVQEVRAHFGATVLSTAIPRSVRVAEAPSYGRTVVTYDPASRGALSYMDAAREIAERGLETAA
jgi:chromosome partitioning protein